MEWIKAFLKAWKEENKKERTDVKSVLSVVTLLIRELLQCLGVNPTQTVEVRMASNLASKAPN